MNSIIMSVTVLKDFRGLKSGDILYLDVINYESVFRHSNGTCIPMDDIIKYFEFFRIDFKE